jgi:hypothetical protein
LAACHRHAGSLDVLESYSSTAKDGQERHIFGQCREALWGQHLGTHIVIKGEDQLTLKKESPGPKTIEGRMMVDLGLIRKKASSAAPFVRQLRFVSATVHRATGFFLRQKFQAGNLNASHPLHTPQR